MTFSRFLVSAIAIFPWISVQAASEYQVDVLVFGQPERGASLELWRPANELQLGFPGNLVDLSGMKAAADERYIDVGIASERLQQAATKMELDEYRVIYQKSWTQPLLDADNARAVLIQGGQPQGDHFELEGYITLFLADTPVLDTQLWLSSLAPVMSNTAGMNAPLLPPTASSEILPDVPEDPSRLGVSLKAENSAFSMSRVVILKDNRRLNPGDLNYVDHPNFGILIQINPLASGEPLETQ